MDVLGREDVEASVPVILKGVCGGEDVALKQSGTRQHLVLARPLVDKRSLGCERRLSCDSFWSLAVDLEESAGACRVMSARRMAAGDKTTHDIAKNMVDSLGGCEYRESRISQAV